MFHIFLRFCPFFSLFSFLQITKPLLIYLKHSCLSFYYHKSLVKLDSGFFFFFFFSFWLSYFSTPKFLIMSLFIDIPKFMKHCHCTLLYFLEIISFSSLEIFRISALKSMSVQLTIWSSLYVSTACLPVCFPVYRPRFVISLLFLYCWWKLDISDNIL